MPDLTEYTENATSPRQGSREERSLAQRLTDYYLNGDKSWQELADLFGGGVSRETLRQAANGKRLRARNLHKIKLFLDGAHAQ